MLSAYLLVSHGSRDPRPGIAMEQLAKLFRRKLTYYDEDLVGVATLEFNSQPLHRQIEQFAQNTWALKCDRLKIIPLFLSEGVHLTTDIPSEIALARQTITSKMAIKTAIDLEPFLGSHPNLPKLLSAQMNNTQADALILLAHGSRLVDAQKSIASVATQLGAVVAYCSIEPRLESVVQELAHSGGRKIANLPYFLFAGSITDAIADSVEQLKLQFLDLTLLLAPPLGVSQELTELIWDLGNRENTE
jgi:sirohydrochlorin ferrochelatase